ncbi:flagellar hook-basal body complex protein FliE [uncultured Ferrimonas sp.]|uniref:flagellar hook-basal body complex protein FliE n=1 Tax=uncultured Ferrimonas sp. TaxID=432640 RepID=UPI00263928A8|nr:flagellar hook-basal body complex protein FliE [uncultured Ferrimonas sp.]
MPSPIMLSEQAILTRLDANQQRLEAPIMAADSDWQVAGQPFASFADLMHSKIQGINLDQVQAGEQMRQVELGQSDDLVGAMVASQKAELSFTAMVQVRNRLVKALDEIINMPL